MTEIRKQKFGLKRKNVNQSHFSSGKSKTLKNELSSFITITLLDGADFLASNVETGKSDPVSGVWCGFDETKIDWYCKNSNDAVILKSKTCNDTTNPIWNQEFTFPLATSSIDNISRLKSVILVKDEEKLNSKDDVSSTAYEDLGQVVFAISDVIMNGKILKDSILLPMKKFMLQKTVNMRRVEGYIRLKVLINFSEVDVLQLSQQVGCNLDQINAKLKSQVFLKHLQQYYISMSSSNPCSSSDKKSGDILNNSVSSKQVKQQLSLIKSRSSSPISISRNVSRYSSPYLSKSLSPSLTERITSDSTESHLDCIVDSTSHTIHRSKQPYFGKKSPINPINSNKDDVLNDKFIINFDSSEWMDKLGNIADSVSEVKPPSYAITNTINSKENEIGIIEILTKYKDDSYNSDANMKSESLNANERMNGDDEQDEDEIIVIPRSKLDTLKLSNTVTEITPSSNQFDSPSDFILPPAYSSSSNSEFVHTDNLNRRNELSELNILPTEISQSNEKSLSTDLKQNNKISDDIYDKQNSNKDDIYTYGKNVMDDSIGNSVSMIRVLREAMWQREKVQSVLQELASTTKEGFNQLQARLIALEHVVQSSYQTTPTYTPLTTTKSPLSTQSIRLGSKSPSTSPFKAFVQPRWNSSNSDKYDDIYNKRDPLLSKLSTGSKLSISHVHRYPKPITNITKKVGFQSQRNRPPLDKSIASFESWESVKDSDDSWDPSNTINSETSNHSRVQEIRDRFDKRREDLRKFKSKLLEAKKQITSLSKKKWMTTSINKKDEVRDEFKDIAYNFDVPVEIFIKEKSDTELMLNKSQRDSIQQLDGIFQDITISKNDADSKVLVSDDKITIGVAIETIADRDVPSTESSNVFITNSVPNDENLVIQSKSNGESNIIDKAEFVLSHGDESIPSENVYDDVNYVIRPKKSLSSKNSNQNLSNEQSMDNHHIDMNDTRNDKSTKIIEMGLAFGDMAATPDLDDIDNISNDQATPKRYVTKSEISKITGAFTNSANIRKDERSKLESMNSFRSIISETTPPPVYEDDNRYSTSSLPAAIMSYKYSNMDDDNDNNENDDDCCKILDDIQTDQKKRISPQISSQNSQDTNDQPSPSYQNFILSNNTPVSTESILILNKNQYKHDLNKESMKQLNNKSENQRSIDAIFDDRMNEKSNRYTRNNIGSSGEYNNAKEGVNWSKLEQYVVVNEFNTAIVFLLNYTALYPHSNYLDHINRLLNMITAVSAKNDPFRLEMLSSGTICQLYEKLIEMFQHNQYFETLMSWLLMLTKYPESYKSDKNKLIKAKPLSYITYLPYNMIKQILHELKNILIREKESQSDIFKFVKLLRTTLKLRWKVLSNK